MTSTVAEAGSELRSHPIVGAVGGAAVACAVLGAAAIQRGQLRADDSPALAVFTIVAGVSFVSAGLIASARRSERWTGAVMVGAGFALFANTLVQADQSLLFTVGLASVGIPAAVLAHLVLVSPEGRLHSRWERVILAGAYFNGIVVQLVMLMFMGIEHVAGCPCPPRNLLFVRDDMSVHARLMSIERYWGLAVAIAVAVVLVVRWSRASRPLRRALVPMLVSGGVAIALLAATLISSSLPYAGAPIKLLYTRKNWRSGSSRSRTSSGSTPRV